MKRRYCLQPWFFAYAVRDLHGCVCGAAPRTCGSAKMKPLTEKRTASNDGRLLCEVPE